MGISVLGRSCWTNPSSPVAVAPNPSPTRWELVERVQFKNAHVLKVRYLDCTNFEGLKIMVYKGSYKKRKILDPHFESGKDLSSPIARFRPTRDGWNMALSLAESI